MDNVEHGQLDIVYILHSLEQRVIQLNKYETIILQIKTKQFYGHNMQKLVKTSKNTEINKQSNVNFWLN